MFNLIRFALIILGVYLGYKYSDRLPFFQESLTEAVESANRKLPRTLDDGVILGRVDVENAKTAVQRVTFPVRKDRIDLSRLPEVKKNAKEKMRRLACANDRSARAQLDRGAMFKYIVEDETGHLLMEFTVSKVDC